METLLYVHEWKLRFLFTDKCRATLDGPHGWSRGWCDEKALCPQCIRKWWSYVLGCDHPQLYCLY